jgi:hypothetical protein
MRADRIAVGGDDDDEDDDDEDARNGGVSGPLMHDAAPRGVRAAPCAPRALCSPAHVFDWARCVATQ